MKWNDILKNIPSNEWKELHDTDFITDCLMQCNPAHLNQSQGTPYTIEPLSSLLKNNRFVDFGDAILNSQEILSDKSLSPLQILFFKELHQQKKLPSSLFQSKISIEKMSDLLSKMGRTNKYFTFLPPPWTLQILSYIRW